MNTLIFSDPITVIIGYLSQKRTQIQQWSMGVCVCACVIKSHHSVLAINGKYQNIINLLKETSNEW